MRLHRFYVTNVALEHDFWLQDERLLHQWRKVLRFQPGQELILFNDEHERLYRLTELDDAAHLEMVTQLERKLPRREVYLLWSLLKKDKNDWVIQKATELGVSHFLPILAERSEKTGFNLPRAQKIAIEAAEQCGRSDIPSIRQPLLLQTALHEYASKLPLLFCEQDDLAKAQKADYQEVGVLIGPEGGWSDNEKKLFQTQEFGRLDLGHFTLRAETAAVAAAQRLLQ